MKNAMKILTRQNLTEMECNVHRFRNAILNAEINKCDNKLINACKNLN